MPENIVTHNGVEGQAVCSEVEELICSECGCELEEGAEVKNDIGEVFCRDCYDEIYTTCDGCGCKIEFDDRTEVNGDCYCDACTYERFTRCGDCDELVANSDVHYINGRIVCDACRSENYTPCDNCGDWVHNDDILYADDSNYCDSCYDYRSSKKLKSHGHTHTNNWHINYHGAQGPFTPFFGIELEMNTPNSTAQAEIADIISDDSENDYHLEEDGSLHYGIEVVTQPRTITEWKKYIKEFDKKVLKPAIKNQATSHNNNDCGLHVHIGRNVFTKSQYTRLYKLLSSSGMNDVLLEISQRKESELTRWANYLKDYERLDNRSRRSLADGDSPLDGRYYLLNLKNKNTVEFRLFRGNLRADRIMKAIEFVHAAWWYTRGKKNEPSAKGFLEYVYRYKSYYKNLHAFLVEKSIYAITGVV